MPVEERCVAYELVYGKGLTPFLRLAKDAGLQHLADGVGMQLEQAAEAFAWGGLPGLVLPLFAFASANGFIVANPIATAPSHRPDRAGAVAALVGAAQYGAGIASSALVGAFADGTAWPMGWVIAATGRGSALS